MFSKTRKTSKLLLVGLAIFAISLMAACGGDDAEPAAEQPTANAETGAGSTGASSIASSDAAVPTPAVAAGPPEVAVVPKEVPEPGSREEKILGVFEQQVRAMNTFDVEMYLETCIPGNITPADTLEFAWTEQGGEYGYQIRGFSLDGFNARDVEFRVYSDTVVRTTFEMFNYNKWVASDVSRNWEKVDGRWYSTAMSCTSNRGTPN